METTASLAQASSCQMFSKSSELQKIINYYKHNPFFTEICEQLEQIQVMFGNLQQVVPFVDAAEAKKAYVKERVHQLHTVSFGNVIHIPFTEQKAPMYIVLRPQAAEQLKEAQLKILPLIELCACEQRDVIILANSDEPIVITKGVMTYDAFMRFMAITDINQMYPFDRFVKRSIAAPLVSGSDIVFVDMTSSSIMLNQEEVVLFTELKEIFQCSMKAVVARNVEQLELQSLFDEVYVASTH